MRDTSIRRLMTAQPACVESGDPVSKARALLESGKLHHLPVLESGRLVGIVTSADLLKLYLLDGDPSDSTNVSQIMERDPVTVDENTTLSDAAAKLTVGSFHALPVVDADNSLKGIITSTDIVEYLLQHIPRGDGSLEDVPPGDDSTARIRLLEQVVHAAELYIRSGHAEREHSVLLKRLAEARRGAPPLNL